MPDLYISKPPPLHQDTHTLEDQRQDSRRQALSSSDLKHQDHDQLTSTSRTREQDWSSQPRDCSRAKTSFRDQDQVLKRRDHDKGTVRSTRNRKGKLTNHTNLNLALICYESTPQYRDHTRTGTRVSKQQPKDHVPQRHGYGQGTVLDSKIVKGKSPNQANLNSTLSCYEIAPQHQELTRTGTYISKLQPNDQVTQRRRHGQGTVPVIRIKKGKITNLTNLNSAFLCHETAPQYQVLTRTGIRINKQQPNPTNSNPGKYTNPLWSNSLQIYYCYHTNSQTRKYRPQKLAGAFPVRVVLCIF